MGIPEIKVNFSCFFFWFLKDTVLFNQVPFEYFADSCDELGHFNNMRKFKFYVHSL